MADAWIKEYAPPWAIMTCLHQGVQHVCQLSRMTRYPLPSFSIVHVCREAMSWHWNATAYCVTGMSLHTHLLLNGCGRSERVAAMSARLAARICMPCRHHCVAVGKVLRSCCVSRGACIQGDSEKPYLMRPPRRGWQRACHTARHVMT